VTPEEAQRGLDTLEAIKAHPDAQSLSPEAQGILAKKESAYRSVLDASKPPSVPSQSLPLRPEQQAHIQRELETTAPPLEEPHHGVGQFASDTIKGLAGGFYSGIPFLAPALEAGGELSDTLGFGGEHNILPRPGQINRAMEESPQGGTLSRVAGASIPLMGQAGMLGQVAKRSSELAMAPATTIYQNLAGKAPGMAATLKAGAGTGVALGAGEAFIRRAPAIEQALAQAQAGKPVTANVPPVDVTGELAEPGLMGGLMAAPGAAVAGATNPNTQIGRRANLHAQNKASGAYESGPLADLPAGQLGIEEAKTMANRAYEDKFPQLEQPVRAQERRQIGALERDMDTFKADAMKNIGAAADETSQAVTRKLEGQRAATHQRRAADMQQLDERTEGQLLDTSSFFDKVNGLVDGFASQSASTPTERALLPNGRALAVAADELGKFLPSQGATMRDLRNAKTFAKSRANSGTDEQRWPYEVLLGELNKHIKAVDPTSEGGEPGLYAQSNDRFRNDKTRQERTKQIVFGGADEAKVDLSPQVEARGRQGLMQLGDATSAASAKLPHREELIRYGYGPEVNAMEQRLADVEKMTYQTQQHHDDAVARVKADVAQQLRDISRELQPQTDAILESKIAQEASTPRLRKLTHPLTLAALGATTHSPAHALSLEGLALDKAGGAVAQPLASAIASSTPVKHAKASNVTLPGFMGMATQAASSEGGARAMVDKAREQKERLSASIRSMLGYKNNAAGENQ